MIETNLKGPLVAPSEAPIAENYQSNNTTLPPRLHRLAAALLNGPLTSRQMVDVIPTTNPHEYVSQLRNRYGLALEYDSVKFTTIDGQSSSYAQFYLTPDDRELLTKLIGQG